jgi:hypothetical protein
MFASASVFNQDISGWDVSQGTDIVSLKVESVNAIECESFFFYFL